MESLLIVSTEIYAGKTGICLSLALAAKRKGKSVGYMKPVGNMPTRYDGTVVDKDAEFAARKLGIEADLNLISPAVLSSAQTNRLLQGEAFDARGEILSAFDKLKAGRDLIVLEGSAHINDGRLFNISASELAETLGARVLLVTKLDNPYEVADDILSVRDRMGEKFLGVICNWVSRGHREILADKIAPYLEREGVDFFGFIPREKSLLTVSVRQLAEKLGGDVLCAEERLDDTLETFMVGAMGQEQALRFFQRKARKAVITGGDRADVQLAALETPTKALILTGNYSPSVLVLSAAEAKGVPVILVDMDTLSAVEKTESLIGHVRVHEDKKVEQIEKLVADNVDVDRLFRKLGI